MRRLLLCCGLSLLCYAGIFGFIADRPLSLGLLRVEILQKTARMAMLPSPKLVILAGSNAPYSHSCAVIGAMLNMPCENAGIAVGIGLDDLFARYAALLHAGDVVYMPMEMQQYVLTRGQNDAAADDEILLRHDKSVLARLPADRIIGAIFCCSFADLIEGIAELPMARTTRFAAPSVLSTQYDIEGDRIDNALADADPAVLHLQTRVPPSPQMIEAGYGTALLRHFVAQESRIGVTVIGGLPTDFSTVALPAENLAAVSTIYTSAGGKMLVMADHSEYPAADFYNSEDHLVRPCQTMHSVLVARALGMMLHRPVAAPGPQITAFAATCPSAVSGPAALRD